MAAGVPLEEHTFRYNSLPNRGRVARVMRGRLLGESRRSIQPRRRLSPSIAIGIEKGRREAAYAGYNLLGDGCRLICSGRRRDLRSAFRDVRRFR